LLYYNRRERWAKKCVWGGKCTQKYKYKCKKAPNGCAFNDRSLKDCKEKIRQTKCARRGYPASGRKGSGRYRSACQNENDAIAAKRKKEKEIADAKAWVAAREKGCKDLGYPATSGYTSCENKDRWDIHCKNFTWEQLDKFEEYDLCVKNNSTHHDALKKKANEEKECRRLGYSSCDDKTTKDKECKDYTWQDLATFKSKDYCMKPHLKQKYSELVCQNAKDPATGKNYTSCLDKKNKEAAAEAERIRIAKENKCKSYGFSSCADIVNKTQECNNYSWTELSTFESKDYIYTNLSNFRFYLRK